MINKNIKHLLYILTFFLYSCSSVQEYVFPTLEDEEVTSPPALEDVPQSIDTVQEESIPQQGNSGFQQTKEIIHGLTGSDFTARSGSGFFQNINKALNQRSDMETVILPIRDGISISRNIKVKYYSF